MPPQYPGALDALTNPAPGTDLAAFDHAKSHSDANDILEAIEAELGTHPSAAHTDVKTRIDKIGAGASAYNIGAGPITNLAWTTAALNTEKYDDANFHNTVTNNGRMTIPAGYGGRYAVVGTIRFATNATGFRGARIIKNGDTSTGVAIAGAQAANGVETFVQVSDQLDLNDGDYVELQALQSSGGDLEVGSTADNQSANRLKIVRLGD
jgi:hypothetical protein